MIEIWRRMLRSSSDDDEDTPEKCRQRRCRRIQMRRLSSAPASASFQPAIRENPTVESSGLVNSSKRLKMGDTMEICGGSSSSGDDVVEVMGVVVACEAPAAKPVFGTMMVSGRLREMEDAIAVRTSLCRPEVSRRMPVHFFAVFDGHGGSHVAAMCRENMHAFVAQELMRVQFTGRPASGVGTRAETEEECKRLWRRALRRSFARMDDVALGSCHNGCVGNHCGCHPLEVILGGSTAVVAVLTSDHIVVANVGDSRAVLCRGGRAVPLSTDHKPDRPDECARIQAAGGRVIHVNGARVEGILAMSRAIGDKYLKPLVISEPEITYTNREPEDECLILASDGLWDVLSSDLACEVAVECLRIGNPSAVGNAGNRIEDEEVGALYPSRSVLAAALLTRLALARGSSDNISVIVIDLKKSRG